MRLLGILLVGLLSCTTALADVVMHAGWEHTSNSNYEDGFTGSVRYEHNVYGNLFVGPEYTYHGDMEHHSGEDGMEFSYGDVSGHSLLLDLVWYPEFVRFKNVMPYIIGGAGWSWWDFEESSGVRDFGIKVDLGDSFAYKVGVGAVYQINESWGIVLEWSFFKADIPKDAYNSDGSYSGILGDDRASGREKLGEEETRLTIGVKYSF